MISSPFQLPTHLVKSQLSRVEALITQQVRDFDPLLVPYMESICATSGKRIRPILVILTAGALGNIDDAHICLATLLELIHMSTLVHDDVIDEASTRRNKTTPNAQWGNGMAVLLGDTLFSHALLLATSFNDIGICKKVGTAAKEVCQGEVIQSQRRFDLTLDKESYYHIIGMKTGALFSASTELAARLSGCDATSQQAFFDYGMALGTAYQVYDDCLDLVGNEHIAGKTLRTDLDKGKLTLPLLLLLQEAPHALKEEAQRAVKEHRIADLYQILGEERYAKALQNALKEGLSLLDTAKDSLAFLKKSTWKNGLLEVCDYLAHLLKKTANKA